MEHRSGTSPLVTCTGYPVLETWDGSSKGAFGLEMVGMGVLHLRGWYRLKNLGCCPGMVGAGVGRGRECLPSSLYSQHFTLFFPLSKKWILSSTLFFSAFRCPTNCNTFMDFFCAIAFDNNLFPVTQT